MKTSWFLWNKQVIRIVLSIVKLQPFGFLQNVLTFCLWTSYCKLQISQMRFPRPISPLFNVFFKWQQYEYANTIGSLPTHV